MTPSSFDLSVSERQLAGTQFAGHLHHVATTSSTQTLALAAAAGGARHGVWIADEQTAGRGRGGHVWHSAPNDGLYFSALVTPALPLHRAMQLSLLSAIAAQAAICQLAGFRLPGDQAGRELAEVDIRWPNDVLLRGRKVGGILIESTAAPAMTGRSSMLRYAVIGIGINCNQLSFPAELDALATSIRRELPSDAPPLRRELLLAALLKHLDVGIRQLTSEAAASVPPPARDLTQYSSWLVDKHVTVPEDGGYTGITAGLNADGFLQVRLADGTLRTVRSGGVREAPAAS